MQRHPLADAYLRIDRAREHLEELKRHIAGYIEANEASSLIKVEGHTVSAIWPPQPPPMFGVRAGEIVYNLRAALDYLVYRLASLDAGKIIETTQFPIEDTPEGFKRRRSRFLRGVNKAHVAAIEEFQPYKGVDWIWILRDLSNVDKHRAVHLAGYQSAGLVRANIGGTEEQAKAFGGFRVPGDDVAMYYPAPIYVAFSNGASVEEALQLLLTETSEVLKTFDPEFEGTTLDSEAEVRISATPVQDEPPSGSS